MSPLIMWVSGVVELGLSLGLGLAVAYISFRLFARWTRDLDEMAELGGNNPAAGILLAGMLLANALIVREALGPVIATLQTSLLAGLNLGETARLVGLSLLYLAVVFVISVLGITLGTRAFLRLTRHIDELAEIRRHNVAVAIVLAAVIVVMALFLSQGIQGLLGAIIPEPSFATIQTFGSPR